MDQIQKRVTLGFTREEVPMGAHICQIYSDRDECIDSLLKFLVSGIKSGERTACFSEKFSENSLRKHFSQYDLDYDTLMESGAISLSGTSETYISDNKFDPDRMVNTLTQFHDESQEMGYPAARVIGEMIPKVLGVEGGDRLLEYESKVSLLLRTHPVTSVCQYDAADFDGATIMDILKVHPQMIVKGTVVHNPFFIQPEEFLSQN